MSRVRPVPVVAAFVAGSVLALGWALADRTVPDEVTVHTTSSPTPSTVWVETVPALPDNFAVYLTGLTRVRVVSARVYPTDELLDRLAFCETGGSMDPRAYNASGPYLGAFQFLQGTWWSVGGEGDPRDHPYAVQREMARTLILQAGWAQFPVCSRLIGAR